MAAAEIKVRMQQRRDTAANWASANPVLLNGELGYETNTGYYKLGNGTTAWNGLSYLLRVRRSQRTPKFGRPRQQFSRQRNNQSGAVDTSEFASNAVTPGKNQRQRRHYAAKIADGAVTAAKIGADQVTAAKLANTAVTAGSYTAADITVDAQAESQQRLTEALVPQKLQMVQSRPRSLLTVL